jgi:hypothetical protein
MNVSNINIFNKQNSITQGNRRNSNALANNATQTNQTINASGVVVNISSHARSLNLLMKKNNLAEQKSQLLQLQEKRVNISNKDEVAVDEILHSYTTEEWNAKFEEFEWYCTKGDDTGEIRSKFERMFWRTHNMSSGMMSIESFASRFIEMRNQLKERYSGEELAVRLELLDEVYDDLLVIVPTEETIRIENELWRAKIEAMAQEAKYGDVSVDLTVFMEKLKARLEAARDVMIQNGRLAKLFVLSNGTGITDSNRDDFYAFITQNTDKKDLEN